MFLCNHAPVHACIRSRWVYHVPILSGSAAPSPHVPCLLCVPCRAKRALLLRDQGSGKQAALAGEPAAPGVSAAAAASHKARRSVQAHVQELVDSGRVPLLNDKLKVR